MSLLIWATVKYYRIKAGTKKRVPTIKLRRFDLMDTTGFPSVSLWVGIASLIFGVIVMIFPKILNYLVGIYLIIVGILALISHFR